MSSFLSSMVRAYIRSSPVEKGKYFLAQQMRKMDPPDKVISQVSGRYLMELDRTEYLQGLLYYYGHYERPLAKLIEQTLRPGSVMVDVGANIGTFSLLAASLGATCHSFEGSPDVCVSLRRNIELNKFDSIVVHECALGDHIGEVSFFLFEETGEKNLGGQSALFRRGAGREIRVPMTTLDSALSDISRVDFIKSDVEGADFLVLRGAGAILEKFHPVIAVEATEVLAANLGGSVAAILETLWGHGYRVESLTPNGTVPVTRSTPPIEHATLVARYS